LGRQPQFLRQNAGLTVLAGHDDASFASIGIGIPPREPKNIVAGGIESGGVKSHGSFVKHDGGKRLATVSLREWIREIIGRSLDELDRRTLGLRVGGPFTAIQIGREPAFGQGLAQRQPAHT
jgi:hypothetical protein